jgi:hypothetical protein
MFIGYLIVMSKDSKNYLIEAVVEALSDMPAGKCWILVAAMGITLSVFRILVLRSWQENRYLPI